jgi:hypothetical protein
MTKLAFFVFMDCYTLFPDYVNTGWFLKTDINISKE